jgi:Mrp family chromosome partitioning ATPase
MSVVEKAGSPLNALVGKKKDKSKSSAVASESKRFDIDFDELRKLGCYDPGALSSPLAMELRAVKRRLLRRLGFLRMTAERQAFRAPGRQRNLVLVTSTQAGEGKTFCALNLALSLALEDQIETFLIDADVPRPKIRARLGLKNKGGLTDCLIDGADWRGLSHAANQGPLTVLGEGRAVDRTAELFGAAPAQSFFTELSSEKRDGLVIIDAPPVLAMTDAVALAKHVDEIVFVVEANETPEPAIASALDELLDVNPNVSLILNRCLIAATGSSYSSYEYYGRREEAPSAAGKGKDSDGDF